MVMIWLKKVKKSRTMNGNIGSPNVQCGPKVKITHDYFYSQNTNEM